MDNLLLIQLGSRIRDIRMQKNMTQKKLAIECEFENASMSRIETGQTNLTFRTLYKICEALDINISDLFKD